MIKGKRERKIFNSVIAVLLVVGMLLSMVPQTTQAATVKTAITVSTQAQLTKVLADKNILTITIKTSITKKITIPSKAYLTKTLVINSPKVSVVNSGTFKKLIVTDVKTFTENAKGNSITINDNKVAINVAKSAEVKIITFNSKNAISNIAVNGIIKKIVLSKKAELTLTGNVTDNIAVQINTAAKGSSITSSIPIDVSAASDVSISLKKGAERSTVTSTDKAVNLKVENNTTKSVKITTPKGKETVAAGTTIPIINEPTKAPENPVPSTAPSSGETDSMTFYTISYVSNGGTLIDSCLIGSGGSHVNLPIPQKNNSIFLGWYTDTGFQNKFIEGTTVYTDLILYAKYAEIEMEQQNLNDSFTLIEQNSELSFTIISTEMSMTEDSVKSALALNIADGSETVELKVTGSSGVFTVAAQNGFTEGASYTLTLSDSKLSFKEKESTIRKCSFSITKKEVYNVELNDGIVYIPESLVLNMTKNGTSVESLSLAVVDLTGSSDETASGTFTYTGDATLNAGDVICIYSGGKPEAPTGNENDAEYLDDEIAYITVVSATGSMGSQSVTYSDAEAEEVLFMPDVLPIAVGDGNYLTNYTTATADTSGSFTVGKSDLNFGIYSDMGLSEETTLDVGDYLAFYTGTFNDASSAASVVYGKATNIAEDNGTLTISFTATTEEEMQETLDYYSKNDVDGETLLDDVDVAAVEGEIEQQVIESGFAEDASMYLTAITLETDGFKKVAGDDFKLESFSVTTADGESANLNEIKLMSISSKISIKNLKVQASIDKKLQKLSGNGLRCAVSVTFDVPIKTSDEEAIVISLSASFVEELKLSVDASGKAVWKWKWIFPYISDYKMNANVDVYNYTGISFKAIIASKNTETVDISKEIQEILSYTESEKISAGVQELFEIYSDMMENDVDWIEVFKQNIMKSNTSLLLGIIQIRTTVDFVVSAEVNVALGCNFDYKSGTRYCFWATLRTRDAGSDTITLMNEEYSFQFYVMGRLGLRAGIKLEFAVGLFSVDLNSVGLTAEAGVYTRLYGYFYYRLDSINKIKNSSMSGALYVELGLYLEIAFKAQVLNGKYQYNPTLFEKEWPLLSAGVRYNVYNFDYSKPKDTIKLKDTVKSYNLPDSTFNMTYLDLKEGDISAKTYKASDFNITFSNNNFSIVGNTIKVNVPARVHKLECDMTVTWKSSALAFSSVPLARTFHLQWDDLNVNGYTISYDSFGGSGVNSVTLQYETTVTQPSPPIKAGYLFDGWYSDMNLTTKYNFKTMPAENIILYAKWAANKNTTYKVEQYQQNVSNDNYTLFTTEMFIGTTGTTVMAVVKQYVGFDYSNHDSEMVSTGIIKGDNSLVLKQYYNRNGYILEFRPENGGYDIVKGVRYGAVISAPTLVKTGYTFKGWDKTVVSTMPATNVTYTAMWTINNYSFEFNSNGGNAVGKITQNYGTMVNAPTIPTKAGYIFSGWYRDSSLTKPYTFSTVPAESIILYAKWDLNPKTPYKVEHYQQNVSGEGYTLKETENLTGTFSTTIKAIAKTYEGFNFNIGANGMVSSGIIQADGALVLKQYYDRKNYTISFATDGGSNVATMSQKYGTAVSTPEIPTKSGYIFEDWYSDIGLTKPYTFSTMLAENITLNAKWNPNPNTAYSVEHYQQNVSGEGYTLKDTENLSGTFDTKVTANPKTYGGFSFNRNVEDTASTGTLVADGSLKLKQYYDRESYTLTFEPENGDNNMVETVKFGAVISNPMVVKTGYTFAGWGKTDDETMPSANKTYTAQWTVNNYSLEFNSNGGSTVDKITQAYDTIVKAPTIPTKAGYIFAGWYGDSNFIKPYTFTMPAESITLYAKWNPDPNMAYIVQHYLQNVSGEGYKLKDTENLTGTYNTTVKATAKTYGGFSFNHNVVGTVSSGTLAADGSLMLKQYYDRDSYTLTFEPENGDNNMVETVKFGAVISNPMVVKTGYTFAGWGKTDDETMPSANKTYTAQWTVNNYSLEFNSNGGSTVDKITQAYDTIVKAPTIPTKAGYIFAGWYGDSNFTKLYTFATIPAESITLNAQWKLNPNTAYQVEHYQQNVSGEGYSLKDTEDLSGTFSTTVTATAKTYVGFTFNSNSDGTSSSGIIVVDGSLVLKQYYDRNSYTLTFKPENDDDNMVEVVKYDTVITTPTVVKTGYTFDSWDKTVDETMPAANRTYTAQWTVNDYTLEFNSNGGNTIGNITQAYDTIVKEPTIPMKAGYIFSAWYSDSSLTKPYTFSTMPAKSITLYAMWNPNPNTPYKVKHYQQNVLDEGYTLKDTESLVGTFGNTVKATAQTYEGFTFNSSADGTVSSDALVADGSLVLKQYYDRNSYTLTLSPENGGDNIGKIVSYGAVISVPTIVKTGYTFVGWDKPVDEAMPAANMTYIAQWTVNNYSLEFNSNGGSTVDKITQAYDTIVKEPTIPTKAGYIFSCWYSDSILTKLYTFSTIPAESTTLYARWSPNPNTPYMVNHYQQNESGIGYTLLDTESLTGTFGTTVKAIAKTYEDFAFNSSVEGTVSSGILVADGSLVLKQYYDRGSFNLTFKLENGDDNIVKAVKFGAVITAPTVMKIGYTFYNWDKALAQTMPAEHTTYTAQWTVNNYTLEFNTNGGSSVGKITQAYDTIVKEPTIPSKAGHLFSGWYSDSILTKLYTFSTIPAENITLYANWNPDPNTAYQVVHYQQNVTGDGYIVKDTENLTGTYNTTVEVTAKEYVGFAFNSSVNSTVSSGSIAADGSLVLKQYYDRNTYTISFVSNEGSDVATINQKYGTDVSIPESPIKTGYLFDDWYIDEEQINAYTFSTMPAESITIYAKWKANPNTPYQVKHYQQNLSDDGYTLVNTENLTGTFDTTAKATAKTYEGFTFNSSAAGTVNSGTLVANGSLVLKQYYDRNTYTISFVSNEGSNVAAINQKYGTVVSAPEIPTKTGYLFGDWYSDENQSNAYIFSTMPAKNIILYVKWVANPNTPYQVQYYQQNLSDEGYTLVNTELLSGTFGTTVTATAKVYEGFNFNGSANGTVNYGTLVADGSLVLKQYYDRLTSNISFVTYGGSTVNNITCKQGATVTKPQDPIRPTFIFEGWYIDSNYTTPYTFDIMWATNITLYAKWKTDGTYAAYQLWVSGVQVNTNNMSNITGNGISGTVSYDPARNTLTLNNATITGYYDQSSWNRIYGIYDDQGSQSLTINVIGINNINMPSITSKGRQFGIYKANNGLTIQGESTASLGIVTGSATDMSAGISINGPLTVTGGVTLTSTGGAVAGTQGFSTGIFDWVNNPTISVTNNSVMKLYGGSANTSTGYINNYGYGTLNLSNGGQIIFAGNTRGLSGRILGASQIFTGQMINGSDATITIVSEYFNWSIYKYVKTIN